MLNAMPSLLTILIMLGVFVLSVALTLAAVHYFRSKEPTDVPPHVMREATELRRRAAKLNTGSDDIEERARRLEQMLSVKRREE